MPTYLDELSMIKPQHSSENEGQTLYIDVRSLRVVLGIERLDEQVFFLEWTLVSFIVEIRFLIGLGDLEVTLLSNNSNWELFN